MTNPTIPPNDPCGPGKLQIAPTRSIRLRTEIPGPVAREWLARFAKGSAPELELPIVPQKTHGTLVYDVDGNILIDFSGGAGLTGYTPDHLVEALRDSVENLIDLPDGTNQAAIKLSERLVSLVPGAERALLFGTNDISGRLLFSFNPKLRIADESQTGLGRTGKLWSYDATFDVVLMKNFAAGLPITAIIGNDALLDGRIPFLERRPPAMTCIAALSVIDYILANDLPRRALQIEARVKEEFATWGHADVVRGQGVLLEMRLDSPKTIQRVYNAALQNGLVLKVFDKTRLLIQPPLMCPEEQLNEALDVLRDALDW